MVGDPLHAKLSGCMLNPALSRFSFSEFCKACGRKRPGAYQGHEPLLPPLKSTTNKVATAWPQSKDWTPSNTTTSTTTRTRPVVASSPRDQSQKPPKYIPSAAFVVEPPADSSEPRLIRRWREGKEAISALAAACLMIGG
jgi:hypothetical protein